MDLDQQIDKTLQKFSQHILELTEERAALEHQKNELILQTRHEESKKSSSIELYNDCNKKITVQNERKNKLKDVLESINEDIKTNDAKLKKQKNSIAKYEQTMNDRFNDMKNAHSKADEERDYKISLEKERLKKLIIENDDLKKALAEEDKLVEKLQTKIIAINEKELTRSAVLNSFIKQMSETG